VDLTPSADNTFTEKEIDLPVQPMQGVGIAIERLELEIPSEITSADGNYCEVALYTTTQSSMPGLSNEQVIAKFKIFYKLTTSGAVVEDLIRTQTFFPAPLVAKNKIYAGFTIKAGSIKTAKLRIGYTHQRVSKQQITQIVMDQFL